MKEPREAKTYRYARRNGWRHLNKLLRQSGQPEIPWAMFNQSGAHKVGTPQLALYSPRRLRGRWYAYGPQLPKSRRQTPVRVAP